MRAMGRFLRLLGLVDSAARFHQQTVLIATTLAILTSAARSDAQPANDMFANRTVLTGTNVTVQGTTAGASTESGEYTGGGGAMLLYTVWYAWTAPMPGILNLSAETPVQNFVLSVGAYKGNAVDALQPAPTSPDGRVVVVAGDTIIFQVGSVYYPLGGGGGWGPFTLGLALEVPRQTSSNDFFANRLSIDMPFYHFDGGIYAATNEPGEPLPTPSQQRTLWWKFVAPEDGLLAVQPSAGGFSATMTLYQGTDLGSLVSIAPVEGTSYFVAAGQEYALQMATDYAAAGNFTLESRFYPSRYDTFATSQHFEGTNITVYGNNLLATLEPNEPPIGGSTIWFSWAAPATGRLTFDPGPRAGVSIAVYTGPTVDRLTPVNLVGLASVWSFLAEEGTVYHFQWAGMAHEVALSIVLEPFLNCSNDNFADAELVKGSVIDFQARSVLGATMELGEPLHRGPTSQKSLWWKWQAPANGSVSISSPGSLLPDVVLAVYQGTTVESLRLLGKGTNTVRIPVIGGEFYYIAGAVAADAVGDIKNFLQMSTSPYTASVVVPGNLLREPSWEGTALEPQYWEGAGGIGGYVNERGGADGSTWPALSTFASVWQDFPTIPGHEHRIRFAYRVGGNLTSCCGDAQVQVLWNNQLTGTANIAESEPSYWHWADFVVAASNTISRITFTNIARNVELDAFSAVDLAARPQILNQPVSISTVAGGTAAFIVGAIGSSPLRYQWFFNDSPLAGEEDRALIFGPVTSADAGQYRLVVTNIFGAVTSAPAILAVDAPTNATILVQPFGDTVPLGGYFNLSVVAAGTPPLQYQWFLNGAALEGATNRNLVLTNVQPALAGQYEMLVENFGSSVWSLPATLRIGEGVTGGGIIDFRNRFSSQSISNEAPVFDFDGVTRLNGDQYVAQLYAGPSAEAMRPAGEPSPFRTGFSAGFFVSRIVTLANVAPGQRAFTQVRAWETARGSSYEEARALGGKFGRSQIVEVIAGAPGQLPPAMLALQSFSLQVGLPQFSVGVIQFKEQQPNGIITWELQGGAGFRYSVEKSVNADQLVWRPFTLLTNITGSVDFTDSTTGTGVALYRARILD